MVAAKDSCWKATPPVIYFNNGSGRAAATNKFAQELVDLLPAAYFIQYESVANISIEEKCFAIAPDRVTVIFDDLPDDSTDTQLAHIEQMERLGIASRLVICHLRPEGPGCGPFGLSRFVDCLVLEDGVDSAYELHLDLCAKLTVEEKLLALKDDFFEALQDAEYPGTKYRTIEENKLQPPEVHRIWTGLVSKRPFIDKNNRIQCEIMDRTGTYKGWWQNARDGSEWVMANFVQVGDPECSTDLFQRAVHEKLWKTAVKSPFRAIALGRSGIGLIHKLLGRSFQRSGEEIRKKLGPSKWMDDESEQLIPVRLNWATLHDPSLLTKVQDDMSREKERSSMDDDLNGLKDDAATEFGEEVEISKSEVAWNQVVY